MMPLVGINSLHSSSSSTRDNREDYQSNESADEEQLQQGDPPATFLQGFL